MWALLFTLGCVANLAYCLYLIDQQAHPGPVLEPRDAAQSGPQRGDGADVDWKLLPLRCRHANWDAGAQLQAGLCSSLYPSLWAIFGDYGEASGRARLRLAVYC